LWRGYFFQNGRAAAEVLNNLFHSNISGIAKKCLRRKNE
jgi:hypothetical protein